MDIRKSILLREPIFTEIGKKAAKPIHRVAALVVIANPYAGKYVEDLSPLFDVGAELAERFVPEMLELLDGPPVSYAKAAIIGTNGDIEHGGALLHPKLGAPFRAAISGGEDIILSNVKVAVAGTPIDIPIANKDNIWSFDEFDTMTVAVADAPRPDEIVVGMVLCDAGRPNPRIGKGRVK